MTNYCTFWVAIEDATFVIPSTIMVMGLQVQNNLLANWPILYRLLLKRGKKKILVASIDFYRPAAREQLKIVAQHAAVDYESASTEPYKAAQEIDHYGKKNGYELLI